MHLGGVSGAIGTLKGQVMVLCSPSNGTGFHPQCSQTTWNDAHLNSPCLFGLVDLLNN